MLLQLLELAYNWSQCLATLALLISVISNASSWPTVWLGTSILDCVSLLGVLTRDPSKLSLDVGFQAI